LWSWGSIVGIATRLWTGQSRVWILVGARDISLFQNVQTGSGAHPASYSVRTGILSQSKGVGSWSSSLTSIYCWGQEWVELLLCLNVVDRENFTFTFSIFFNANDISYLIIFFTTFCILIVCMFTYELKKIYCLLRYIALGLTTQSLPNHLSNINSKDFNLVTFM
jgi:hypothetical protein